MLAQSNGSASTSWAGAIILVAAGVGAVTYTGATRTPMLAPPADESAPGHAPHTRVEDSAVAPKPDAAQWSEFGIIPASSPWAPGTTVHFISDYPQPGVPFRAHECTIAFSFDGADGRSYAVTAAHCGKPGDLVYPQNGETMEDYVSEAGRMIYSGFDEDDPEARSDIGIVEIVDPSRPMTYAGDPPERTILGSAPPAGEACKIGGASGVTCGPLGTRGEWYIMLNPRNQEEISSTGDVAFLCAQRGDSGGPILVEMENQPVVVGLISGTRSGQDSASPDCSNPAYAQEASVAYVPWWHIREVIYRVVPDARIGV